MSAGFFSTQSWQNLMSNDFNRGFATGLAVAAAVVILLLVVWLIMNLTVWSHRSSSVTVDTPYGGLEISRTAISQAVERELNEFPELRLIRMRLFKNRSEHRITLNCEFRGDSGLVEVAEKVRPKLKEALRKIFGVDKLNAVDIVIERYGAPEGSADADAPAKPADGDAPRN